MPKTKQYRPSRQALINQARARQHQPPLVTPKGIGNNKQVAKDFKG